MKKLCWFALSLGAAFLVFCSVAALCLFLSTVGGDGETETTDDLIAVEKEPETLRVVAVYLGDSRILACELSLTPAAGTVDACSVDLGEKLGCEPLEILENEGFYPLIGKISENGDGTKDKFVAVSREKFIKIADICGGMVYNDQSGEVLLTGSQADKLLDSDNFTEFCAQAAKFALDGGLYSMFSYLADNTQNNLSYPALYTAMQF